MDIGIMPLPDNAWTRGKCGVKALQYMAVSIPAVCSPVGINDEIVLPGVNGFLPETEHQWESALAMLIEDEELRRRQGLAGRGIVEEYHSQDRTAQRLIGILSDVADGAD